MNPEIQKVLNGESEGAIVCGDCLKVMAGMPDGCVDAVVTDPPYGLKFMGKAWDHGVPGEPFWREALRVAKPGCMLLAFGGDRTHHRLMVAIEDAGWEIRTCIYWVFGSGFPKSLDISKAIDKAAGAKREAVPMVRCDGKIQHHKDGGGCFQASKEYLHHPVPITDAARQWSGWGTALKPAAEIIILAMKPLDGTFAHNALTHGVAGLNVDGCRIEMGDNLNGGFYRDSPDEYQAVCYGKHKRGGTYQQPQGRWPANLILDEQAGAELDRQSGVSTSPGKVTRGGNRQQAFGMQKQDGVECPSDTGGASRFFYCSKASRKDRNEGCGGLKEKQYSHDGRKTPIENAYQRNKSVAKNNHATVKPTDLMAYLCRLVTPPGGVILDMFFGSGSTGKAAKREGFKFIGIERDEHHCEIARNRIASTEKPLFAEATT